MVNVTGALKSLKPATEDKAVHKRGSCMWPTVF